MKKLKVLHLASFIGNIGDNANHKGVRRMFKRYLKYEMFYEEIEIRDYYISWGKRFFNKDFIELVNKYDLLIIGGGNFFDLYIDKSVTGTTLNISNDILEKIKTPILFFGLGCDPYKGASEEILNKFRNFLKTLIKLGRSFISVRNDGSIKNIKEYVGENFLDYIHHVPDGGFFTEIKDFNHPEVPENKNIIAVNVAGDMTDIRFELDAIGKDISYTKFIKELAYTLNQLLEEDNNIDIVFVPHIFRDLKAISEVLENLKDEYRRKRITVAPYLSGNKGHDYIFDIYKKANLTVGMRFHTNVCSIGFNTPTIGFSTKHLKVRDLYEEVDYDRILKLLKGLWKSIEK